MVVQSVYLTVKMLRWNGPITAAMLRDLFDEDLDEDENFRHHHENSDLFEKHFRSDHIKLKDVFRKVENPFEEQPLINVVVKRVYSHCLCHRRKAKYTSC